MSDVRASDAEREAAVDRLREAAGEGRLTLEELAERTDAAYAATTRGELERVGHDLPTTGSSVARPAPADTPPAPARRSVFAVMGGSDVHGSLRFGPELTVIAIMGGHEVDLNDAVLEGGELTITVVSIMGGSDFRVPEGVHVVHEVVGIMGGDTVEPPIRPPPAGAPVIRFRGLSLMGGNSIKRGRKQPRRRRRGPLGGPPHPPRLPE
jgi:hypothetical protein